MYRYDRADFIETDLKPHLLESYENYLVSLQEMGEKFEKQKTRLSVVRQEKEKARVAILGKTQLVSTFFYFFSLFGVG